MTAEASATELPIVVSQQTLLVAVIDKSGSMWDKRQDVVGGYNAFLAEQQALPDPCRMLRVKFNTEVEVVDIGGPIPIRDAKPMDPAAKSGEQAYLPGGLTALYDALMAGVGMADKHRAPGERVLVLVITDGLENSSRETTMAQVQAMIQAKQAAGGWTFAYVGEAPGRWTRETGTHMGGTIAYEHADPRTSFAMMSGATAQYRASAEPQTAAFFGGGEKDFMLPKPVPATPIPEAEPTPNAKPAGWGPWGKA